MTKSINRIYCVDVHILNCEISASFLCDAHIQTNTTELGSLVSANSIDSHS